MTFSLQLFLFCYIQQQLHKVYSVCECISNTRVFIAEQKRDREALVQNDNLIKNLVNSRSLQLNSWEKFSPHFVIHSEGHEKLTRSKNEHNLIRRKNETFVSTDYDIQIKINYFGSFIRMFYYFIIDCGIWYFC